MERGERKKALCALAVAILMVGAGLYLANELGRSRAGSLTIRVDLVPWQEGQTYWAWVPVLLHEGAPVMLPFDTSQNVVPAGSQLVEGPGGSWLNVTGNHTLTLAAWATIENVETSTGFVWSAFVPGPDGGMQLRFAAGGSSPEPIGIRVTAHFSSNAGTCTQTVQSSEMIPSDGVVRTVSLVVSPAC